MFKNIIHFIKYNNSVVFILLFIFLLGSGVFAQTEAGQEVIGKKHNRQEGIDNTLLLQADLDNFDMKFQIEKIEKDEHYYYITYTYVDLVLKENVWQYEMVEKVRKVASTVKKDIGEFIAEELKEQYYAKIKDLKKEKSKQLETGEQKRIELDEYSGLIGQTLTFASKIIPGYEPVKKKELPSPSMPSLMTLSLAEANENEQIVDRISDIYNDYIDEKDPDIDNIFGNLDNCPLDYNPLQEDSDQDGMGDSCDKTAAADDSLATTTEELEKTGIGAVANPEIESTAPGNSETDSATEDVKTEDSKSERAGEESLVAPDNNQVKIEEEETKTDVEQEVIIIDESN